ncbi:MAG: HAD family hydrolase, partial [Candidatus Omnitrophota bacterium]
KAQPATLVCVSDFRKALAEPHPEGLQYEELIAYLRFRVEFLLEHAMLQPVSPLPFVCTQRRLLEEKGIDAVEDILMPLVGGEETYQLNKNLLLRVLARFYEEYQRHFGEPEARTISFVFDGEVYFLRNLLDDAEVRDGLAIAGKVEQEEYGEPEFIKIVHEDEIDTIDTENLYPLLEELFLPDKVNPLTVAFVLRKTNLKDYEAEALHLLMNYYPNLSLHFFTADADFHEPEYQWRAKGAYLFLEGIADASRIKLTVIDPSAHTTVAELIQEDIRQNPGKEYFVIGDIETLASFDPALFRGRTVRRFLDDDIEGAGIFWALSTNAQLFEPHEIATRRFLIEKKIMSPGTEKIVSSGFVILTYNSQLLSGVLGPYIYGEHTRFFHVVEQLTEVLYQKLQMRGDAEESGASSPIRSIDEEIIRDNAELIFSTQFKKELMTESIGGNAGKGHVAVAGMADKKGRIRIFGVIQHLAPEIREAHQRGELLEFIIRTNIVEADRGGISVFEIYFEKAEGFGRAREVLNAAIALANEMARKGKRIDRQVDFGNIEIINPIVPCILKPILVVCDVHGTLLKATWKKEYRRAFQALTGREITPEWEEANIIHKSEDSIIAAMSVASQKSVETTKRVLEGIRRQIRLFETNRPIDGALEFVRALNERNVPLIAISDSERSTILKQLKDAGFLQYIPQEHVVGRYTADKNHYERSRMIEALQAQYPHHTLVYFDDWREGIEAVKKREGICFGLPQGEAKEFADNRQVLVEAGVNYIIKDFSEWQVLDRLLTVHPKIQLKHERASSTSSPVSDDEEIMSIIGAVEVPAQQVFGQKTRKFIRSLLVLQRFRSQDFNFVRLCQKIQALLSYQGSAKNIVHQAVYNGVIGMASSIFQEHHSGYGQVLGIAGEISGLYEIIVKKGTTLEKISLGKLRTINELVRDDSHGNGVVKEFDAVSSNTVFEFKFHLTLQKLYQQVIGIHAFQMPHLKVLL